MKPGLQHLQMLAVRAAINGDDTQLQQIRQSRNHASKLPDSLHAFYPTPDICIYTPKNVVRELSLIHI